jgi:predicted ATPase
MVLTGSCPAYGEGITYWPLREIVLEALDATGAESVDGLAATLGIQPSVARRVAGLVVPGEGEAGEETGWAFVRLVAALARLRPVVVDDVHWAEPALLDLLLDAAGRLRDVPAPW